MAIARRLTFTLSPDTVVNLTAISGRLGISRSGLVEEILSGACAQMIEVLDIMPTSTDGYTTAEARRLRGASVSVLQQRVDELRNLADDM